MSSWAATGRPLRSVSIITKDTGAPDEADFMGQREESFMISLIIY